MLRFQLRRQTTVLYKRFLEILEHLGNQHDEALAKLREHLPTEHVKAVDLADHFTPAQGDLLRKAVLDAGNDCLRGLESTLEDFDIDFKR